MITKTANMKRRYMFSAFLRNIISCMTFLLTHLRSFDELYVSFESLVMSSKTLAFRLSNARKHSLYNSNYQTAFVRASTPLFFYPVDEPR